MTGLNLDVAPLTNALSREAERRRSALLAEGRQLAARMGATARTNHPWNDRTGYARSAIRGRAEAEGTRIRISLTGGAPYSAALEAGHGGRYAVLGPTVRRFAPELLRALAEGGGA